MHLIFRAGHLSVASKLTEVCCTYIQRQQQFQQQQCGIHLCAPLSCQPKLKVNAQPNSRESLNPSVTKAKPEQKQLFEPSLQSSSSSKKTTNDLETPEKRSSGHDDPKNIETQEKSPPKQKLSREAVSQNVRGYVLTRFTDYVKNYDKVLEKNFPGALKLYHVFSHGMRAFYADIKQYIKIKRIVKSSPDGQSKLNRKELELYMQIRRDMVKVAPVLIGTSLPMVGYAFFPLVFMYPGRFLTSHFWTLQQRIEFQQLQLQDRFNNNRPVLRFLQAKLKTIRKHEKHDEFSNLLDLIGNGFHPTVDAILNIKEIFASAPYSLQSLSGKHIKHLYKMHGIPGIWLKRFRLQEHALLVSQMDLAIGREGGAHNMPLDAIQKSCAIRGLNPANMSKDDMIFWLRDWIKVSTSIQEDQISLFLHLPIFLAYNHPNNMKLIHSPNLKSIDTKNSSTQQ